jgi:hypothetical protein
MSVKSKFAIALLLLLAIGLPMLIKGPDGRPMMTVNDWLPDMSTLAATEGKAVAAMNSLQSMVAPDQLADSTPAQQQASGQLAVDVTKADAGSRAVSAGKMYKWQDGNGRWHFSSERPVDGQSVSVENLPDVKNVMEAPVKERDKSSTMNLPGGFSFGGGG